MSSIKCYSELISIPSFEERLRYLKIFGEIGVPTFGGGRWLNQLLYHDPEWKHVRNKVILRDSDGDLIFDLAHPDHPFFTNVYVHHLNPITKAQVLNRDPCVFDLENLVACCFNTHELLHYGNIDTYLVSRVPAVRTKNDTCLWR